MSRKAEHICIGGLALQTACTLGCFLMVPLANSRAVFAEAWHFALGIGVWLLALLHLRFRRAAAEERLDEEAVRRRHKEPAEGIFGREGAADEFSAQARLARVEKWLVPIGSLAFGVGMIVVSVLMATGWGQPVKPVANALAGLAAFCAIMLLTFLMSRYAIGQSQEADSALLRGPGSFMLSNTLCSAAVAVALTAAYFGALALERIVAWIIIAGLGVLGVEMALMFIVGLYRPRRAGREARAPYDSRLLGLLSMPKGLLRSAAETLDYQFGFKVSETWFFRFLERALMPLILFGLLTLYLLDCFLVVPADSLAFVERFGQPRAEATASGEHTPKAYGPGLHLKWPRPIEVARVVPAQRVQQIMLGVAGQETGMAEVEKAWARGEDADLPPFVWSGRHFEQEYNLVVATRQQPGERALPESEIAVKAPPVSLLTVSVPVQFVVRESQLYRYVYTYADVAVALEAIAYRQLVRYVAGVDLIRILGPDREKAGDDLQRLIQDAADAAGLGVDIVFVGLHGVHPPSQVAPSFEAHVSALQERRAAILDAGAYAIEKIPTSKATALKTVMAAKAERVAKRARARKDATRFAKLVEAYNIAPRVFALRWYMDGIEEMLKGRRVIVVPPGAGRDQVVEIDLTPKLSREILRGFGPEIESLEKGSEKK